MEYKTSKTPITISDRSELLLFKKHLKKKRQQYFNNNSNNNKESTRIMIRTFYYIFNILSNSFV